MSAVTQLRSRDPGPERETLEYAAALSALSELTTHQLSEMEMREALRLIVARACSVLQIERAAVYVRDQDREVFVGCAAHPGAELESAVRRLVLGGPGDQITREILQTREPLLLRNARSDPRGMVRAVRAWKLRSLLGVPMIAGDDVLGLIMFDNGHAPHPYAPADVKIAAAFGALGGFVLSLTRETSDLRSALETATRQNKLLRRTAVAEHRLSDAALRGGGLHAIVDVVATLSGKPTALFDAAGRVAASHAPTDAPPVTLLTPGHGGDAVRDVLEEIVAGASATVEPRAGGDLRRRHLAAPVDVRGDRWGWLVMMEHRTRLVSFDDFLIRRGATHLALELTSCSQSISAGVDARAALARQLIRGTSVEEDLRRGAEYLGISLAAHRIVAYLPVPEGERDTGALTHDLGERLGSDVLATRGPEGVALLIEVPDEEAAPSAVRRVKSAIARVLASEPGPLTAGLSGVCRSPGEIPGGYRMARQVTRCIESFAAPGQRRVLAADDLGPGRLFVANGHKEEVERFVEDTLGCLLGVQDEAVFDLLRTLEAFYETGRSVRLASEQLGVHENTIRYRLARIHSMIGLDVAGDADDQLSVQVALLVLRLQGHPALRPLDDGEDECNLVAPEAGP